MKTTLKNTISSIIKGRTASALMTAAAMVLSTQAGADNVSQAPLSLSVGVPPNIIFTLDESGSMSWGYVPDAKTTTFDNLIGGTYQKDSRGRETSTPNAESKRFRAANTNPMAYNPNVVYQIPPAYNANGTPLILDSSFENAKVNGFETSYTANQGARDLTYQYRVIKEHRMPRGTFEYATHHSNDSQSFLCSVPNVDGTHSCTVKNGAFDHFKVTFEVTRTTSSGLFGRTSWSGHKLKLEDGREITSGVSGGPTVSYTIPQTGPAHYYEFDGTLDNGQCEFRKDNANAGGEACYRARIVDRTAAYDESGNRLKHPDKTNSSYPKADGDYIDGRSNFAIWYSFYRSRALATVSAASIAFDQLTSNIRFTWQDLATCRTFKSNDSDPEICGLNSLKPYNSTHKGQFYTWLRSRYFNVGTPLPAAMQRAGEYLKNNDEPWLQNPTAAKGENNPMYGCRANYHVLMTDGMWNTKYETRHVKNRNSWTHSYSHRISFPTTNTDDNSPPPYGDRTKETLADMAMHYWATDLRSDLDNNVPKHTVRRYEDESKQNNDPRNNPADWQHMTNFILGLGLTNALDDPRIPWEGGTHIGPGFDALMNGTTWPVAGSTSSAQVIENSDNVYDLWHAAINSRGEFYSVDDPDAMVQAFKDILDRIAERESTAARPGLSSSMQPVEDPFGGDDGTERLDRYFYHTSYDSAGWSGELRKTRLVRECVAHEIEGTDPDADPEMALECEEVASDGWRASDKMPAHGARNIKISDGSNLVNFDVRGVNGVPALRAELSKQLPSKRAGQDDTTMAQHINYLRGDRSLETSRSELFRARNSVLGDMLGSSPAFAGGPKYISQVANKIDSGYEALVTKANNRPSMIYVGANDGMLHGFDAETGVEKFAFIPTAVFGKLRDYIDIGYSHRFYVDGTPVIADAYNGTEWRTILVGTLRAGGKGIFALDVTDPTDIKLLWELNEGDVRGQVQPGYSFPEPTVARMHNGRWAVITGNGYEGAGTNSGKAALFVIDAFTGETRSLEVTSEAGGKNGLSTPRVVDLDGDGVADFAYAGDLQGNLWRFDLLGATASGGSEAYPNGYFGGKNDGNGDSFKPSYNGKPLFVAKDDSNRRQPITAPPTVVRHPSGQGYIVIAGTGKYFAYNDDTSTELNSLYGVWDANTRGPSSGNPPQISRSNLVEQKVTTQSRSNNAASGVERDVRVLSSNTVDWANPGGSNGKLGWYLDLRFSGSNDGERIIEGMRTLGNMLLFQTLLPNNDPCGDGSTTWLYALNPATGGSLSHDPFGYDRVEGGVVSGISFGSEGGFSLSQGELDFSVHSGGEKERINPPPESMGRQTWRIIHNP